MSTIENARSWNWKVWYSFLGDNRDYFIIVRDSGYRSAMERAETIIHCDRRTRLVVLRAERAA
jgi:hypothetical protein